MNKFKYDEKKGEFVEIKGQKNPRYLKPLLLVIGVILIILIVYKQGVFDNTSSTNEQPQKELLKNMHGFIGDYPVTMQLTITGSVVKGSYFYDEGSSTLLLSGTNENGNIALHETTAKGRPTGFFQGKLSKGRFNGKFTNSKGQVFTFIITER